MIKNLERNRKAEGYVDACVGVIAFVMILIISLNIFSFITLKVEMDDVADRLLETATYNGCFGTDFYRLDNEFTMNSFYYDINYGADEYYNSTYRRVQLGKKMWVEISVQTYVKGLGVFKIPVTLKVKKTGLSEKYWK